MAREETYGEPRRRDACATIPLHASRFNASTPGRAVASERRPAFTLIELLTVIAIIGVLAAFLIPVMRGVMRRQHISVAQSEMAELETAIGNYHAVYGFYPPSGTNALANPLYYELVGTTSTNTSSVVPSFTTLDGLSTITGTALTSTFGIGGLMNYGVTNRAAGGEDVRVARNYLPQLRSSQLATNNTTGAAILVYSGGGTDPTNTYNPLSGYTSFSGVGVNPWRYNSSNPTNNPGSYDLYVQIVMGGTSNLVCNWSSKVQMAPQWP